MAISKNFEPLNSSFKETFPHLKLQQKLETLTTKRSKRLENELELLRDLKQLGSSTTEEDKYYWITRFNLLCDQKDDDVVSNQQISSTRRELDRKFKRFFRIKVGLKADLISFEQQLLLFNNSIENNELFITEQSKLLKFLVHQMCRFYKLESESIEVNGERVIKITGNSDCEESFCDLLFN